MRINRVTIYFDKHCVVIIHWFEGKEERGSIYRVNKERQRRRNNEGRRLPFMLKSQAMKRENDQKNKRGKNPWPLPAYAILLNTGCHWLVVTYEPKSSFMPLPGPQLKRRILRASVIRRSYFGFFWRPLEM